MVKATAKTKNGSLRPGDVIGVIALSSPCASDLLSKGVGRIEKLGFKTKLSLDPAKYYGKTDYLFSSDSPERRARALEKLFLDEEVKAIIAARGAYGSMEVLPHFDFKLAKKHPKPLIGFSDTTAFLVALYQLSQVKTVHGPAVSGAFANAESNPEHNKSVEMLCTLLTGDLTNPFKGQKFRSISKVSGGKGNLVGGSLTLLCSLLGTPWEVETKGKILFIEESGERPYRVLRMLTQLELANKFKDLAGILLGNFKDCTHSTGPTVEQVLVSTFSAREFPVLHGLPFGHDSLNLPMPLGVEAEIDDGRIEILDSIF